MCTAVSFHAGEHYFGRTLDHDRSYGEAVVVTPRRFPLRWRNGEVSDAHYAMIGVAHPTDALPLYYDAVNEKGLCAAGLRFAESACYSPQRGAGTVASFELIPWVLARAASVAEARELLSGVAVTDEGFSADLPPSPLHFLLADDTEALVAEPVREGLRLYENPVGVLTNEPPFLRMLERLATAGEGIPGGGGSVERFIRAARVRERALSGRDREESVSQILHILGTVERVAGCTEAGDGAEHRTLYTSCCLATRGIYYYTTYHCRSVISVELWAEEMDGRETVAYPMLARGCIYRQNG